MVSSRLKDIIFKKLYSDLSRVEIIHYKTYIWFIDREDKCWYFRYDKSDGTLLWKYSFFSNFFTLFTMCDSEFTPILSSWVEEVLNCKVNTTVSADVSVITLMEDVLNYRVNTTTIKYGRFPISVKEVLNCKVTTTINKPPIEVCVVEEVVGLNHNV